MRKLITLFLLLSAICAFSQTQVPAGQQPSPLTQITTNTSYIDPNTGSHWFFNGTFGWWNAGFTINGGAITTMPSIGFNPGVQLSASQWILNAFYGAQPPTAGLTGGTNLEISATSSSSTLNWQYGRQTATPTIVSAVINPGSFNIFGSQPTQPGSITGTQSVTIPATGSIIFTETVTATGGGVTTSSTTYNRLPRFYYGYSSTGTPTQSDILAFAGGSNPLQAGHTFPTPSVPITVTISSSSYPWFAYAASQGVTTVIKDVNGFDVHTAFNQTTVSVTNASGYTQNYYVYTLNAATGANYTITFIQ